MDYWRQRLNQQLKEDMLKLVNDAWFGEATVPTAFPGLDSLINTGHTTGTSGWKENIKPHGGIVLLEGLIILDTESGCRRYRPTVTVEARETIDQLTDEELTELRIFRDPISEQFISVGFFGRNNVITKWADKRRALAVEAIEKLVRMEERR